MGVSLSESKLPFNVAVWRGENILPGHNPLEWHENVRLQSGDGDGLHAFYHDKQVAMEKSYEDDEEDDHDPTMGNLRTVISVSFSVLGIWILGMNYEPKKGYVVERWLLTNMTREEFDNYDW